jgi:hypothetical protein
MLSIRFGENNTLMKSSARATTSSHVETPATSTIFRAGGSPEQNVAPRGGESVGSLAAGKHVAATLYGIGARLDAEPELLFRLRKVDAKELVARAGEGGLPIQQQPAASRILDSSKLAAVFGLDLAPLEVNTPAAGNVARKSAKQSSRKAAESTVAARKNKKKKGATARRQARV